MPEAVESSELDRRVAEVEALRRRVLNVIPHALRTPITTFRGLANALDQASDAEVRGQIAPALQRLAAQAENLLDDLLIASGVTTALPTSAPVATEVVATARRVWASFDTDAELEIDAPEVLVAHLPDGVLHKVFVHVLDNARKYGTPPVRLVAFDTGSAVVCTISDAGVMSEDDAAAAFEPFFRAEPAVLAASGLGVGLSVSRALLEQAGGAIDLAREPSTTVTLKVLHR